MKNKTLILQNLKSFHEYKGFIFDLDGTLLDSKADIVEATNATIVAMGGVALDSDLIASFVGRGVRDLIHKALKDVKGVNEETASAFFTKTYKASCTKHSRLFAGVDEFLFFLKDQKKISGVLTNKPQNLTDEILKNLNRTHFFKTVIGAEAQFACKPDPAGLLWMIKDWGLQPNEILYFGDSEVDAQTAANAGCDLALYLEGYIPEHELQDYIPKASVVFRNWTELHQHFVARGLDF